MIFKLIWRNLWRNSRRTAITVASIAFAVVLSVLMRSLQKGTFDNLIKNVVGYYSGYIQIHKTGYWNERVLENSFDAQDSIMDLLKQNPHITSAVPRLETFVLASYGTTTKGCMLVGTEPAMENSFTHLQSKLVAGRYFDNKEEAVVMAEGLAKRLNVGVGDTVVLFGQGYRGAMAAGKFNIKGIVHLAIPTMNDAFVYLPLSSTRYFLSAENMLTSVILNIDQPGNMDVISEQVTATLGDSYEVMTWKQMMPEIESHIKADGFSAYVFTGVLYLIIAFGFFGTILMMTAERRYEFGMLIAIGMKKIKLGLILLGETIFISLVGVLLGVGLGLPLVIYLKKNPITFTGKLAAAYEQFGFEAIMPTEVDAGIFTIQSAIVLCLALLIGLYPLWHIHRLDATKAMKH